MSIVTVCLWNDQRLNNVVWLVMELFPFPWFAAAVK